MGLLSITFIPTLLPLVTCFLLRLFIHQALKFSSSCIRVFVLERGALMLIILILSFRNAYFVVSDVESVMLVDVYTAIRAISPTEYVRSFSVALTLISMLMDM